MTSITSQISLMANHKVATSMTPGSVFEVLQTPTGDTLFFSIGSDGVFRVTRELLVGETGWTQEDLSSALSGENNNAQVVATTFDVYQNPDTNLIDIVLAITVTPTAPGSTAFDLLYIIRGHAADTDSWTQQVTWTKLDYNSPIPAPAPFVIGGVHLMKVPSTNSDPSLVEYCFVNLTLSTGLTTRFYITSDNQWTASPVEADIEAKTLQSCPGRRSPVQGVPGSDMPGTYSFGTVGGDTNSLLFAPQQNLVGSPTPVIPARLSLPKDITAITSASNSALETNLFVAGENGLYVYGPGDQHGQGKYELVVPAQAVGDLELFTDIISLSAITTPDLTAVWILNQSGMLFKLVCAAGSETTPEAWTPNILPFSLDVVNHAFYINAESNMVLFTHHTDDTVYQHKQDVSGIWTSRKINLAASQGDDVYDTFNSFTTVIKVTDAYGSPIPQAALTISSDTAVSVLIDNVSYNLSSGVTAPATSDSAGTVTIIQETTSLAGIAITAVLQSDSTVTSAVDPLSVSRSTVSSVNSTNTLQGLSMSDGNGGKVPLIDTSTVSGSDQQSVVTSLQQLVNPPKSSSTTDTKHRLVRHHERAKQLTKMSSNLSSGFSITHIFGDVVRFFKSAVNTIKDAIILPAVSFVQGVWQFTCQIGGKIVNAIASTAEECFHAIELVLSRVEVFFKDLVAWLGFLFDWNNFVRTHTVIKTELTARINAAISSIDIVSTQTTNLFDGLEDKINKWAGITDPGQSVTQQQQSQSSTTSHLDSPQSNWARYHTKNGMSNTASSLTDIQMHAMSDNLDTVIQELSSLVTDEETDISNAMSQIKDQVISQYHTLTPVQIITKILAILGDLILKSAGDIIVKILAIVKIVATDIIDTIGQTINIPVISDLYQQATKDNLSILDLVCLVAAIPCTIVYEIVTGKPPFPDDVSVAAAGTAGDAMRTSQLGVLQKFTPPTPSSSPKTVGKDKNMREYLPDKLKRAQLGDINASDTLSIIFDVAAAPGVGITTLCDEIENASKYINCANYVGFLLLIAPSYEVWENTDTWPVALNLALTTVTIGKKYCDVGITNPTWIAISPFVDSILSMITIAPTVGVLAAGTPQASDWLMFAGTMCFLISGMYNISSKDPDVKVVQTGLNCVYGILSCATAVAIYEENE